MPVEARAGITRLTINGSPVDLRSAVTYTLNTLDRSEIMGQDGMHGYKDPPVASTMEFTVTDSGSLSVLAFQSMVNVAIEIQLRTGKRILGLQMFSVGTQDVDSAEATIKVKFKGPSIIEIPA